MHNSRTPLNDLTCCTLPRTAHCPHALVDGRCPVDGCMRIHHGRENAALSGVIEARQMYADIVERGQHLQRCGYNGDTPCTCYVAERLDTIIRVARLYPEIPLYDVEARPSS